MEFSRIGKHTIKCVISEEEIYDLGFTLDDIMSNGERTQEFMNQIFDMAEQKFDTKFELGIKTVRADFLSDHSLSLTFSEHPASEGMMEHLKDIVNGLINSIPQEKWKEIKENKEKVQENEEAEPVVFVMLQFESFEHVNRFARVAKVDELPPAILYKFEGYYYLHLDLSQTSQKDVMRLSVITDEYASDILAGKEKSATVFEHGECIIKEKALEILKSL